MRKIHALIFLGLSAYSSYLLAQVDADNSAVNQRDRDAKEATADKQPMVGRDTEITRKIRYELVKDDHLSTYAKNIKIITDNGSVTLKGPVRSEAERRSVLKKAQAVARPSQIHNEMTVTKSASNKGE